MMTITIKPYQHRYKDAILSLSIESWATVFYQMRSAVPAFVYDNFYPQGWESRQTADLSQVLDEASSQTLLAFSDDELAGWLAYRIHPEDRMGEIYVVAVSPKHQGRGIATRLLETACQKITQAGMKMVMVETGGDPGHLPARQTYEAFGFEPWPVARYFKKL
ncbi:GNAT family N-acetyltransferase [Streptococcus tangpeifui]|uniref:N-acetyltransferase domain-containing protein n=1 Tax=Streptococcus criceti HS-6 TaxID=873449 RepID=G5JNM1_STRCG|nr:MULTISPECIES: GNAT family N-acetyltransferase [Streptococcus]EHI73591.1 hypothetical protein STRCR_1476 [Streptococcus criceti HS-6]SUN43285.1 Uncharacterized N-acetyltransferase YsnE [Streptococcus criceti]